MMDEYEAVFGGAEKRLIRGRLLGDMLALPLERIPRFRDAWVEKWQNPDREPGVGALVIAMYCHIPELTRAGVAERVFDMRSNPHYRDETSDQFGYMTFRFDAPADLDDDSLAAMAARAVDPVDTDVRWATALGQTLKGTE